MTKTLELAIERLRQEPDERQDLLALLLLYELDEDQRWNASTAIHAEKLQHFVDHLLAGDGNEPYETLDPDNL